MTTLFFFQQTREHTRHSISSHKISIPASVADQKRVHTDPDSNLHIFWIYQKHNLKFPQFNLTLIRKWIRQNDSEPLDSDLPH